MTDNLIISKPKIGFIGTGWIGRCRMKSLVESDLIEPVAIYDLDTNAMVEASKIASKVISCYNLEELLKLNLDGVVIATPNSLHAEQAIKILKLGIAVFCQKPLARTYNETLQIIEIAKGKNCLLGIDFSYRYLDSVNKIINIVKSEELGNIFKVKCIFHNAYGPNKQWFYDPVKSGGGCLIDLGIHLIDLTFMILNFPSMESCTSKLYSSGKRVINRFTSVEDYASSIITLDNGAILQLECSWNLHAGQDAVIELGFFGTKGGIELKNVNGSFYKFETYRYYNTKRALVHEENENWGGKAIVDWAKCLTKNNGFQTKTMEVLNIAKIIDTIYSCNEEEEE